MFDTPTDLKRALQTGSPSEFVSRYLFEDVPVLFERDMLAWVRWKTDLAALLDVDPKDIVLIGSACIGYSLSPGKLLKKFSSASDVDLCIVSPHHFDVAWRTLRRHNPAWLSQPKKTREAIKRHRQFYVFDGTIAADMVLSFLPFGQSWQKALDKMGTVPPTQGYEIKLRIYRDYEALRSYHARNVVRARSMLLEDKDVDEEPIDFGIEVED